jgi:RNA polymerase sigma-70 factor (sigma-E family)
MLHSTTLGTGGRETVIDRARHDELAEAYGTHAPDAVRLAFLLTGDGELARDLVQDAFVRVAARWPRVRDPERFRSYLRKTVANLAKNHFRRRALERRHLAGQVTTHVPAPESSTRDDIFDRLLELPVRQRTAIVLRYYLDLSEREAADAMGCSVAALKSLSGRGLRQLREEVSG